MNADEWGADQSASFEVVNSTASGPSSGLSRSGAGSPSAEAQDNPGKRGRWRIRSRSGKPSEPSADSAKVDPFDFQGLGTRASEAKAKPLELPEKPKPKEPIHMPVVEVEVVSSPSKAIRSGGLEVPVQEVQEGVAVQEVPEEEVSEIPKETAPETSEEDKDPEISPESIADRIAQWELLKYAQVPGYKGWLKEKTQREEQEALEQRQKAYELIKQEEQTQDSGSSQARASEQDSRLQEMQERWIKDVKE